jgi:hypothetical protein
LSSVIQAGYRFEWELAVDLFEADQVVSVAGTVGETLEADDAAQAGYEELDSTVVGSSCALLDRVIVTATSSSGSSAAIGSLDGSQ